MTDAGLGVMDLMCPAHQIVVGRLIKHAPWRSVQYAEWEKPRRCWPEGLDDPYTRAHCRVCDRAVIGGTSALRAKMTALVEDESEFKGDFTLSFE
jgi:hypothetical protein